MFLLANNSEKQILCVICVLPWLLLDNHSITTVSYAVRQRSLPLTCVSGVSNYQSSVYIGANISPVCGDTLITWREASGVTATFRWFYLEIRVRQYVSVGFWKLVQIYI